MTDVTKKHIVESFNELLRQYPFDKITAKMIIEKSHVSKSTFYRMFMDKYDVLYCNYKNNIEHWINVGKCEGWEDLFAHVFASAASDHAREKNAFSYYGYDSYFYVLYAYSLEFVENVARKCRSCEMDEDEHIQISHFCYGLISIYYDWVKGKIDYTSDELAHQMYLAMPDKFKEIWC